jgi:serine/threonine protein kinase
VFAHDPERMARFQREAEVLASLYHPNIATIHGVGSLATMFLAFAKDKAGASLVQKILGQVRALGKLMG